MVAAAISSPVFAQLKSYLSATVWFINKCHKNHENTQIRWRSGFNLWFDLEKQAGRISLWALYAKLTLSWSSLHIYWR